MQKTRVFMGDAFYWAKCMAEIELGKLVNAVLKKNAFESLPIFIKVKLAYLSNATVGAKILVSY